MAADRGGTPEGGKEESQEDRGGHIKAKQKMDIHETRAMKLISLYASQKFNLLKRSSQFPAKAGRSVLDLTCPHHGLWL